MSSAIKGDFPDADTRFAEALEELTQSIETGEPLEDVRVYKRPNVDVAALRKGYGMTQQQFADAFGITIGTLRNWEQGRRIPDGPAQRLLEIIEDRPEVAIEVLGGNLSREGGLSPEDFERAVEIRRRGLEARAARNRPEMKGPAKDAESGRSGLFAINKLIHRIAGPAPAPGSASSSEPKTEPDEDAGKDPGSKQRHGKAR